MWTAINGMSSLSNKRRRDIESTPPDSERMNLADEWFDSADFRVDSRNWDSASTWWDGSRNSVADVRNTGTGMQDGSRTDLSRTDSSNSPGLNSSG